MAHVAKVQTPTGEPRYRVFIRRTGHRTVTKQFRRKTDAERWARQTETAIDQGLHFPVAESRRQTVGKLVERYIAEVLPERPERDQPRVAKQLRWWSRSLGSKFLADLTPADIAEQRDRLMKGEALGGGPVKAGTTNRYLAALSHACTVAVREWGWLEGNPVRKVRRPREPRGRVRFLSDEERDRLLTACQASQEERLYPLVLMAISTGARRGELLGLRWRDIDLKRARAVIRHSKNGERRPLPLAGPLLEVLSKRSRVRKIGTDLVFAGGASGAAHFPRRPWERALEEAGIKDFTFHDLRHSAASYLAMSGATLTEIAEVLGHKTLAMVKRYSHLTEQHTAQVVARMNRQIFGT